MTSVKLMGGSSSFYKMNVDGSPGTLFNNIEIEANDSLHVFVQVNVNPNTNNLPFILRDSIQISYNGKNRLVQLEAWGQNAHFYRSKIVSANEILFSKLTLLINFSICCRLNGSLMCCRLCAVPSDI